MTKLILTRHGQSTWNAENRFTGWVDVDLSDKGVEEAEKSGQIIRDLNIKRVVHSTANGDICIRKPPDYESDHITMGQKVYDKKAKSLVR